MKNKEISMQIMSKIQKKKKKREKRKEANVQEHNTWL
jgi:hypothetical protein